MPIYDYQCSDCGHHFEELVWNDERPNCSDCGGSETKRSFPNSSSDAEAVEYTWGDEQEAEDAGPRNPRLRGEFPELWDVERDFEKRQQAQLVEIAQKSVRIGELMQQVEELEPLIARLAERDAQFTEAVETIRVLTAAEFDQRTRLEESACELRERESAIHDLKGQLEVERNAASERWESAQDELRDRDARIADLLEDVRKLETDLASRTAALFKRDEMIQDADETISSLREEAREWEQQDGVNQQQAQQLRGELERKAEELRAGAESSQELCERIAKLEAELHASQEANGRAKAEIENLCANNEELKEGWANSKLEVEHHRAKFLESVRHLTATHSVLEELRPMLDSLETTLTPNKIGADGSK